MNGDQSRPTELGAANRQDGIFEVPSPSSRFSASLMRRPLTLSKPMRQWNTQGRSSVDGQAKGSSNTASSKRYFRFRV